MPRMGKGYLPLLYVPNGAGRYIKAPVLTTTQRDALTAEEGMVVFNSTTDQLEEYDGSTWQAIGQVILDTHAAALDAHVAEMLTYLLRGANILPVPTNAGWSGSSANAGGVTSSIGDQQVYVQTTASARGLMSAVLKGLNVGDVDASYVDWDKKLYIIFNYARTASDAEVIARFQLKQVATEGALAAKGIGIRADNYALQGESYGTTLGVVDLGVTMTTLKDKRIVIVHDPSVPKIEWYVDGVLKGTQSTAANIPSGSGAAEADLVHSIVNGVTGGVTCRSYIFAPWIWQER